MPAGALKTIDADNNALLALSDIQPGEILLADRFGSTPVGAKAIEVPSGMLAMSVELTDPARVGKFVTPGSHIAIYQSYKIKDLRDTPEAKLINENDINGTSVLLPDLLVIGMGETPLGRTRQERRQEPASADPELPRDRRRLADDAPVLVHGVNNRSFTPACAART